MSQALEQPKNLGAFTKLREYIVTLPSLSSNPPFSESKIHALYIHSIYTLTSSIIEID